MHHFKRQMGRHTERTAILRVLRMIHELPFDIDMSAHWTGYNSLLPSYTPVHTHNVLRCRAQRYGRFYDVGTS
ncbi:hypothetical protein Hamer_G028074 [Homarus americanus]|uniref:Uncharacterized protein n=2 Tax=Homarus americanus TaxID=6706 RepID=A0A8J5J7R2_HOMAM|nr:hypothetical protein Hamer_G028074 [Homarus americanus]